MKLLLFFSLAIVLITSGCSTIRKTPKTSFSDGYYIQNNKEKVYIDVEDDVLRVHKTISVNN
jgi:uncharacterized protein YceK